MSIKYSGKMRDWKLTEVAPVQGPFDVKVTEVSRGGPFRGGAEYQVDVTLKPTAKAGPHLRDRSTSRPPTRRTRVVQVTVTANVASPLELAPGKVRFEPSRSASRPRSE